MRRIAILSASFSFLTRTCRWKSQHLERTRATNTETSNVWFHFARPMHTDLFQRHTVMQNSSIWRNMTCDMKQYHAAWCMMQYHAAWCMMRLHLGLLCMRFSTNSLMQTWNMCADAVAKLTNTMQSLSLLTHVDTSFGVGTCSGWSLHGISRFKYWQEMTRYFKKEQAWMREVVAALDLLGQPLLVEEAQLQPALYLLKQSGAIFMQISGSTSVCAMQPILYLTGCARF